MNRHAKSDLKEVRVFLVALGIVFVALVIMGLVLGIIWKRAPIPTVQDDSTNRTEAPSK